MRNTISAFLIAMAMNAFAQTPPAPPSPPTPPTPPEPPRKEKVESMRIAFITQKLDLTPDEAQKFWPVYNEFNKKRDDLQMKRKQEFKNNKGGLDSLSDKQIETIVDGEMAFKQKMLDLEKEYHSKLKSVLPIKKVAMLYRAEEQFTHKLLQEISGKGKQGHGGVKKSLPPPHPNGDH